MLIKVKFKPVKPYRSFENKSIALLQDKYYKECDSKTSEKGSRLQLAQLYSYKKIIISICNVFFSSKVSFMLEVSVQIQPLHQDSNGGHLSKKPS